MAGWSPAPDAMKVRSGERGQEAGLGPSLLGGGEPRAKLSEVGRGRGCARRGRRREAGGPPASASRSA